jgi:exodeoxyribonuclease V alpha subunit
VVTDTLRGQVESVRVFRDSWGVITLLSGSATERTTVTGTVLGFDVGDTVEARGDWDTHPRWGRQFRAREIETIVPTDASGAIEWIRGRMPQVGRRLATRMVAQWGLPGLWEMLEHRPGDLVDLRGITEERAAKIGAAYREHRAERDRIVAMKRYALTDRQIGKLTETFGERALEEVRRDPYCLIELVDGFGWQRSDDLARRMGLPADHPSRIRAAVLHLLQEAEGAGHVYVPAPRLVAMAARLLGSQVDEAMVRREANELLDAQKIVRRGAAVYRPGLAEAEAAVAASVLRLLSGGCGEEKKGSEAA